MCPGGGGVWKKNVAYPPEDNFWNSPNACLDLGLSSTRNHKFGEEGLRGKAQVVDYRFGTVRAELIRFHGGGGRPVASFLTGGFDRYPFFNYLTKKKNRNVRQNSAWSASQKRGVRPNPPLATGLGDYA